MVGAGQYEASLRVAGPNDLELVPLHSGPVFHVFSYCFSAAALALVERRSQGRQTGAGRTDRRRNVVVSEKQL